MLTGMKPVMWSSKGVIELCVDVAAEANQARKKRIRKKSENKEQNPKEKFPAIICHFLLLLY